MKKNNRKAFYSTLDASIQEIIINKVWDIGPISWEATVAEAQIQAESDKWVGKIGLMNYMDWFNGTTSDCSAPTTSNGGYWVTGYTGQYTCCLFNYLYKNYAMWTISPVAGDSNFVFSILSASQPLRIGAFNSNTFFVYYARPAFYITSNIH